MKIGMLVWLSNESPNSVINLIRGIWEEFDRNITILNLAVIPLEQIEFINFDLIIVHNTSNYFPLNYRNILEKFPRNLRFIVLKQDEHLAPTEFDNLFVEFPPAVVFSTLKKDMLNRVYPKSIETGVIFEHMYTAYITKESMHLQPSPLPKEKLISYRGSLQPWFLGRLGEEKAKIPDWLYDQAPVGWSIDASSRWEDRLFGEQWNDLLNRSWLIAASESGSNCFNFDENRNLELITNQTEQQILLEEIENNINYATIAPRHLEASLQSRAQLLLPGEYEGLFVHGESAIFTQNKFSNLCKVLSEFEQQIESNKIGFNAKNAVMSRSDLRISHLANLLKLHAGYENVKSNKSVLLLVPHPWHEDPRNWYWKESFESANYSTKVIATEYAHSGTDEVLIKRIQSDVETIHPAGKTSEFHPSKFNFSKLEIIVSMLRNELELNECTIAHKSHVSRALNYILSVMSIKKTVDQTILLLGIDLFGGIAAMGLSEYYLCGYIYDAQEIFSRSISSLSDREMQFWDEIEAMVIRDAVISVTVSPGIAKWYLDQTDAKMTVLPNWVPKSYEVTNSSSHPESNVVKFVLLGRNAPKRNISNLITAWPQNLKYELHLYVPDIEQNKQVVLEMKNKKNIYIHEPVSEIDIIPELSKYDVGVIPYNYDYPYNHCSPNKFGQYLASGLAVLSSNQPFVSETITSYGLGKVFTWINPNSLISALESFSSEDFVITSKLNSLDYFRKFANFEHNFSSSVLYKLENQELSYVNYFGDQFLNRLSDLYFMFILPRSLKDQTGNTWVAYSDSDKLNRSIKSQQKIRLLMIQFIATPVGKKIKNLMPRYIVNVAKRIIGIQIWD